MDRIAATLEMAHDGACTDGDVAILIEFDEKESPEIIDEIMKYGFDDVEEKTENEENSEINTIDVSEAAKESIDENIDENADNIGNN